MAMVAAVAALAATPGTRSIITGFGAVATSYPGFADDLRRLTGARPPAPLPLIAIDGPAGAGSPPCPGPWRPGSASSGSIRARCTAPWPPWPWPGASPPTTMTPWPPWRPRPTSTSGPGSSSTAIDVTDVIRSPEVGGPSPWWRRTPRCGPSWSRQRAWAVAHGGGVVEGRDIGNVVFPQAEVKVYLTASPEERTRRRQDETAAGVARRDHIDSTRVASPLAQAPMPTSSIPPAVPCKM